MKTRPVEAKYYHADGQIDMTKLTVAFRNSANAGATISIKKITQARGCYG